MIRQDERTRCVDFLDGWLLGEGERERGRECVVCVLKKDRLLCSLCFWWYLFCRAIGIYDRWFIKDSYNIALEERPQILRLCSL